MNFLAHAYLSGSDPGLITGNFIADWIKGKKVDLYPDNIKKGIILHRSIDYFTDNHDIYKKSKLWLYSDYQKYSGIVIDVFYDHFLAKNWSLYSEKSLKNYSLFVYYTLVRNFRFLPPRVKFFLPNLIAVDRLGSYVKISGIRKALELMARFTSLPANTNNAIHVLENYYDQLESEFNEFFPQIINNITTEHNISLISHQQGTKD